MWLVCRKIVPHADCICDVQIYSVDQRDICKETRKEVNLKTALKLVHNIWKDLAPLWTADNFATAICVRATRNSGGKQKSKTKAEKTLP